MPVEVGEPPSGLPQDEGPSCQVPGVQTSLAVSGEPTGGDVAEHEDATAGYADSVAVFNGSSELGDEPLALSGVRCLDLRNEEGAGQRIDA